MTHADLKPDNVMRVSSSTGSRYCIIDFSHASIDNGISPCPSYSVSPDHADPQGVGYQYFLPPAFAEGTPDEPMNSGVDVYSLAALAVAILFKSIDNVVTFQKETVGRGEALREEKLNLLFRHFPVEVRSFFFCSLGPCSIRPSIQEARDFFFERERMFTHY